MWKEAPPNGAIFLLRHDCATPSITPTGFSQPAPPGRPSLAAPNRLHARLTLQHTATARPLQAAASSAHRPSGTARPIPRDFADTFCGVSFPLLPMTGASATSGWRLSKSLEYVDTLMQEVALTNPPSSAAAHSDSRTLALPRWHPLQPRGANSTPKVSRGFLRRDLRSIFWHMNPAAKRPETLPPASCATSLSPVERGRSCNGPANANTLSTAFVKTHSHHRCHQLRLKTTAEPARLPFLHCVLSKRMVTNHLYTVQLFNRFACSQEEPRPLLFRFRPSCPLPVRCFSAESLKEHDKPTEACVLDASNGFFHDVLKPSRLSTTSPPLHLRTADAQGSHPTFFFIFS